MLEIVKQAVPVIDMPGEAAFFEDYVWPNRPVVIRGFADGWAQGGRWSPQYLLETVGNRPVRVTVSEGRYDFDRASDNWIDKEHDQMMDLVEVVGKITEPECSGTCIYLHQKSVHERFPELIPAIRTPELVPSSSMITTNLWFGSAGNVSSLHYDQPNNFLVQLHGRKKLFLFSPDEWSNLYPSDTIRHFSRISLGQPDYSEFPRLAHASGMEVELEPGDSLFLPPFWWHEVHSTTASISVNMFWRAYTHQQACPAMVSVLPEIHRDLPQLYSRYLPGRLPTLIEFATHLCERSLESAAMVVGGAVIRQRLVEMLTRENPWAAVDPQLPDDRQTRRILDQMQDAGYVDSAMQQQIIEWLEMANRALQEPAGSHVGCKGVLRRIQTWTSQPVERSCVEII